MNGCRGLLSVVLMLVLLLSACLGPIEDRNVSERALPEPVQERMVEERSFSGSTGMLSITGSSQVSSSWSFSLPVDTVSLELVLEWESPVNEYTLVVERPDGKDEHHLDRALFDESPSFIVNVSEPASGAYQAYLVAQGVILEDEFTLDARWEHIVWSYLPVDESVGSSTVTVYRDGDKWRADMPFYAAGSVTGPLTLDVETFNGRVEVDQKQGGEASADVQAWARADTAQRAEDLVRLIQVSLSVDGSDLQAHAKKGPGLTTTGSESVGASVKVQIPVEATGSVKTSNGRIVLDDLVVSDLTAKTSNGRIEADLETSGSLNLKTSNGRIKADLVGDGDIELDTSNGRIELTLDPTGDTSLGLDTSNGRVKAQLKEGSGIGYELHAKTSNSKISENMQEASLDGDEKEGTLRTSSFADRSIQVTGDVRTSNGKIEFVGN